EIEHPGRRLQALGMFGAPENSAAIGALALEHAACIVQPMAEHMQVGVDPGHELTVVPDDSGAVVEGFAGHSILLRNRQAVTAVPLWPGFATLPRSRYGFA